MAPAQQHPPSLLISTSAPAEPAASSSSHPHNPSNSPFRYVDIPRTYDDDDDDDDIDAADPLLATHPADVSAARPVVNHPLSGGGGSSSSGRYPPVLTASSPLRKHELYYPSRHHHHPSARTVGPPPLPLPCRGRPRGIRIPERLKPWLGIGSWAVTTIAFLLAIAFWKKEVFTGLDQLSVYLQSLGSLGYAIMFCLIFITTIPPFPLYSTLIILSGYTFGVWTGAAISYTAALAGAVIVFLLSRHYLRDGMTRLLSQATGLKCVVRAIEKRPKLLLLIRVAPYPYNLMNVLLASSHTLSFSMYFTCTALSLVKVVIHTSVGSSIHSFAGYHAVVREGQEERGSGVGKVWTVIGVVLCFAILVYLSFVARRAVDEELGDERVARAEEGEMREVVS